MDTEVKFSKTMKDTERTRPSNQYGQCSFELTETKAVYTGSVWVCTWSFAMLYGFQFSILTGFLSVGMSVSLIFVPAFRLFFYLSCLIPIVFVLS